MSGGLYFLLSNYRNQVYRKLKKRRMTRVLIIDDDTNTTDMLKLILEPAGFEVITVNSSDQSINFIQQWTPDIIILDLVMPAMSGWEICGAVRKFSQVPILVLSVLKDPALVAKALDEGADDVLIKPMRGDTLVARINTLARRAHMDIDSSIPQAFSQESAGPLN